MVLIPARRRLEAPAPFAEREKSAPGADVAIPIFPLFNTVITLVEALLVSCRSWVVPVPSPHTVRRASGVLVPTASALTSIIL